MALGWLDRMASRTSLAPTGHALCWLLSAARMPLFEIVGVSSRSALTNSRKASWLNASSSEAFPFSLLMSGGESEVGASVSLPLNRRAMSLTGIVMGLLGSPRAPSQSMTAFLASSTGPLVSELGVAFFFAAAAFIDATNASSAAAFSAAAFLANEAVFFAFTESGSSSSQRSNTTSSSFSAMGSTVRCSWISTVTQPVIASLAPLLSLVASLSYWSSHSLS